MVALEFRFACRFAEAACDPLRANPAPIKIPKHEV